MKLLTARLIENPKIVTTKYGARMVADAQTPDGEKLSVWRPENDQTLGSLRIGAQVVLSLDSKGKVNLIDNPPETMTPQLPPAPTETKPTPTMTTAQKKEIAGYIEDMASLYAFCYSQAGAKLPQDAPPETRQACASSLFIASQRRFNLA